MKDKIAIKAYLGDFKDLQLLINGTYQKIYRDTPYYSILYLKNLYSLPSNEKNLWLGAYNNKVLVGFVCGLKTYIKINKKIAKTLLIRLISIDHHYQNERIFSKLFKEILQGAKAKKYKFIFYFCRDKYPINKIIKKIAEHYNFKTKKIASYSHYYKGISEIGYSCPKRYGKVCNYKSRYLQQCAEFISNLEAKIPLIHILKKDDLKTILNSRDLRFTKVFVNYGKVAAYINYIIMGIDRKGDQKIALIENIFWNEISKVDRFRLLKSVEIDMKKKKVFKIVIPDRKYFNCDAINKDGYKKSFLKRNLIVTFLDKNVKLEYVKKFYFNSI